MPKPVTTTYTFIIWLVFISSGAAAETCLAPSRPFVPNDSTAAREYENLIRRDFEKYISDVQNYFHCLEIERARAFIEAQDVTQEYGNFVQQLAN